MDVVSKPTIGLYLLSIKFPFNVYSAEMEYFLIGPAHAIISGDESH